eukprot:6208567-Pleurochrysis_carterae.AAC.8
MWAPAVPTNLERNWLVCLVFRRHDLRENLRKAAGKVTSRPARLVATRRLFRPPVTIAAAPLLCRAPPLRVIRYTARNE